MQRQHQCRRHRFDNAFRHTKSHRVNVVGSLAEFVFRHKGSTPAVANNITIFIKPLQRIAHSDPGNIQRGGQIPFRWDFGPAARIFYKLI